MTNSESQDKVLENVSEVPLTPENLTIDNFGTYLKQKRNEMQVSLDDVFKVIRISPRVLHSFEQNVFTNIEDFDAVYLRMYLKKYANFLGIPDSIIDKQIFSDTAKKVNKAAKLLPNETLSNAQVGLGSGGYSSERYISQHRPSALRKILFLLITLVIVISVAVIVVKSSSLFNTLEPSLNNSNPTAVVNTPSTKVPATIEEKAEVASSNTGTESQNEVKDNGNSSLVNKAVEELKNVAVETASSEVTTPKLEVAGVVVPEKGLFMHLSADCWLTIDVKDQQGRRIKRLAGRIFKQGEIVIHDELPQGQRYYLVIGAPHALDAIYYNQQAVTIENTSKKAIINLPLEHNKP